MRPEGALSSVLSRDIPDRAGTGRLEKSPAGIAARVFFLSYNRSSEWYESNGSRHHRQRSELVRPKYQYWHTRPYLQPPHCSNSMPRSYSGSTSVTPPVQSWRSDCFSLPSERQREIRGGLRRSPQNVLQRSVELAAQSGRSLQSSRQVSVHDHGSRGSRSFILVT
jgi:hypothetical protein